MPGTFEKLFGQQPSSKGGPLLPEPRSAVNGQLRGPQNHSQTYSKVFRWRLPDGQTQEPGKVEVVGTFNHWQPTPMLRDGALDSWHVTIHHIPGNRTHHYMFLIDGKPAYDKNCDGLAVPNGPQEEQFALAMPRGPRVFMLFAQTK
jgi:hypothetical protein